MIEKEELIKQIKAHLIIFENLNDAEKERYSKDKDVMLLLLKIDILNIENVHTDLLNNEAFMKICLKEDVAGMISNYIPEHLINDRVFMEYAVEIDKRYIAISPFVDDTEWVAKLLSKDAQLFKELPDHIRENKKLVLMTLQSIEEWTDLLDNLSMTYLGNKDFIIEYLLEAYDILNYISPELQKDAQLVIKILGSNPNVFTAYDLHEDLKENIEVLSQLIAVNPEAFLTFETNIKNNIDLIARWTNEDSSVLFYVENDVVYKREFLDKIKNNFMSDEHNELNFPNIWQAIKAYEREDGLKEHLDNSDQKIAKKKKKI